MWILLIKENGSWFCIIWNQFESRLLVQKYVRGLEKRWKSKQETTYKKQSKKTMFPVLEQWFEAPSYMDSCVILGCFFLDKDSRRWIELIYDIIHNIEKNVPRNTDEVRDNVLMPTYRFVTSTNFIIGVIAIVLLLALMLVPTSFAMIQASVDHAYLNELYVESNGTDHIYGFKICAADEPVHYAKVIVTSDSDMVVVYSDKTIHENKCRSFGVGITANAVDSIQAKLVELVKT